MRDAASAKSPHQRLVRSRCAMPRFLAVVTACSICVLSFAQEPVRTEGDRVTIHFPEEVDLQVLVDYVGKALDIHFLYGEEIKGKRVELRPAPLQLEKDELLDLLVSLLRVRDLAIVEESPRLFRIVQAEQTARSVSTIRSTDAKLDPQSLRMVTQVLQVPPGEVKNVAEKLSGFLSLSKGALVPLPDSDRIIITDYESRIAILKELLAFLTAGPPDVRVETIAITGADPTQMAAQISAIAAERHRLRGKTTPPPSVRGDILPQALVVVGIEEEIRQVADLVGRLAPKDVELVTRAYMPRYLSVERAKGLIENVAVSPASDLRPPASVFEDRDRGRLFITADAQTHQAIASLLEQEDQPLPEAQRPMRIYRPQHRKASEILGTISQLLGEGIAIFAETEPDLSSALKIPPGPNRPPSSPQPMQVPPMPPAQEPIGQEIPVARHQLRVEGSDYVLTADEHTNSILAIGTREFHAQLEGLIEDLDQRRPQVLIEMTLVAITIGDTMNLGFELETLDLGDGWDYLLFSNFGLSNIDVTTGQRVLIPGIGANGVLMDPEHTPVVMRALATRANARVISTPKLLVSDNARGTLRNVDEAPFTSVNASDTVATTSFAGFESAGTTLNITPHLSQDGNFVSLEYDLSFSNFTGASSTATVPPPRTTNSFTSTVEVPDGYTLITGGLIVNNKSDAIGEVPYLGRIPLIGFFFQNRSRQNTYTKIFAFIRPTILRDDEFEALKFMTLQDAEKAGIDLCNPGPDGPLWMH